MAKILVVDDDTAFRTMLLDVLSDAGYTVEEAENGTEALAKIAVSNPDLLIIDVMMPDMYGTEVVKKVRANILTRDIPVIFMTGSSYAEIDVAFKEPSLKHKFLLSKTAPIDEVLEKVKTVVPPPKK